MNSMIHETGNRWALALFLSVAGGIVGAAGAEDGAASSNLPWTSFAEAYLSKIENLKVKYLKPRQTADQLMLLRWMRPSSREAKADGYRVAVYAAGSTKAVLRTTLPPMTDRLECHLPIGEYTAAICPFKVTSTWVAGQMTPVAKWGRVNEQRFAVRPYVKPMEPARVEELVRDFEARYAKAAAGAGAAQARAAMDKWLAASGLVLKASWQERTVTLELKDYSQFVISLDTSKPTVDGPWNEVIPLPKRPLKDLGTIPFVPLATTCPLSPRAFAIDSLTRTPAAADLHEGETAEDYYRRMSFFAWAAMALETIGYGVEMRCGDDANLDTLAQLDEGGFGVILYAGHGDPMDYVYADGSRETLFSVSIRPAYDTREAAEASHYADYEGVQLVHNRIRLDGWAFVFNRVFVDQYLDDVRFPGSFLYLFACSGGLPISRETMYPSFYERGVSAGWVGFEQADADTDAHYYATKVFFENLVDPAMTFRDSIPDANTRYEGHEGPAFLTLFDEEMGDNSLYIRLPDLVVTSMVLDGQSRLNVGIQNIGEGTIRGSRHEINLLVRGPRGEIVYHGAVPFDALGPMQTIVCNTGIDMPAGTTLRAQVALVGMVESDTGNNALTAPASR